MNLPDHEERFLKELNKVLYNFLWDGKNDKIRWSGVCQAYEVGGFKMVGIKSFLAELKISWLKRILHDDGKLSIKTFDNTYSHICQIAYNCIHVRTPLSLTSLSFPLSLPICLARMQDELRYLVFVAAVFVLFCLFVCLCLCVCFAVVFCLVSVLVSCSFTCYTMLVILILLRLATYILNSHRIYILPLLLVCLMWWFIIFC